MKRKKRIDMTGCPLCGGRMPYKGGFFVCEKCGHMKKTSQDFYLDSPKVWLYGGYREAVPTTSTEEKDE